MGDVPRTGVFAGVGCPSRKTPLGLEGMIASADDLSMLDAFADRATDIDIDLSEAGLVDLLDTVERDKAALSAVQVRATVALDARARERQSEGGPGVCTPGWGVGAQVALARHEAPDVGRRYLALSKILDEDMPRTMEALRRGVIGESRAMAIATEVQDLPSALRRIVDQEVHENPDDFTGEGLRMLANRVRRKVQEVDPQSAVARASDAARDQYISFIPAPDAMMRISGMVPVEMGLVMSGSIEEAVASKVAAGDSRTKSQLRVDEFYERTTGSKAECGVPVTINLVMTDRTLFQSESEPAELQGYGTIPAAWARWIVTGPKKDAKAKRWIRRIFTAPVSGELVAMDSVQRIFPQSLRRLIAIRDLVCRTPGCNAPIRQMDHIQQWANGGPTSAANGSGRCQACNLTKEGVGWSERVVPGRRHTLEITTPTGHTYRSTAPPLPGTG